jgi:hypothetical protein
MNFIYFPFTTDLRVQNVKCLYRGLPCSRGLVETSVTLIPVLWEIAVFEDS